MNNMSTPPTSTPFGFVEWFRQGEHERVLATIEGMAATGAAYLRTHLSWAEYYAPGGQAWYDWLIPTLANRFELLPCVHYTPPSLSRTGRTSGPPQHPKDLADFVDLVLTRHGEHFRSIELWNEPNNLLDWDWRQDPEWMIFCEMVGGAAYWAQHRGWRAVLAGPCPFDTNWLHLMGRRGVLATVSAVGFHGFPGTWDSEGANWRGYAAHLSEMRDVLDHYNPAAEIWITEAGYSTWRHDEGAQVERFRQALAAPADRMYWYGWQDIPREIAVQEGLYFDPRHYHLGVTDAAGRPKLLRRLLQSHDHKALTRFSGFPKPALADRQTRPSLVIGGAGFIGANLADRLLQEGEEVIVLDNLSRPGVERNLLWLQARHAGRLHVALHDVRDQSAVGDAVADAGAVFHLAAQVAVTSSLLEPLHDFAVNLQGTLTLLESMRRHAPDIPLLFASTNKVYGPLDDIAVELDHDRHLPRDPQLRARGIDETQRLAFCTPYGCSKGAADQYVLDYANSFGLRAAVLRMSCIYGPRQFGTEDQGWVAHFLFRALQDEPITIYGDGKQVRDILHVQDAVAAYRAALRHIDVVAGRAFNLGGGPANAVSLVMVLQEIEALIGSEVTLLRADTRKGDQPYFVADTTALENALGWHAKVGWQEGLHNLAQWVQSDLGIQVLPKRARETRVRA